jgi:hypothetical protein
MDTIATRYREVPRQVFAHATLPPMHRASLVVVALVLVASVVLGPLAMALDGCAALGMCDGPCGVTCGAVFAGPTPARLHAMADAVAGMPGTVSSVPLSSLEPPPKSSVLSL